MTQSARPTDARLTGRYLLAFALETAGLGLLLSVPLVWIMPLILSFDPTPYAMCFGVLGPLCILLGLLTRPRVLRPDFVNSIMLYQEDQS
jgi:uncharacterized membrane protein YphA (DoxX/SURF4 family)